VATIIPTFQTCRSNMTPGERRFGERLVSKLDDASFVWFNIPVGVSGVYPDFIVFNPCEGLWVIEIKDWHKETILSLNKNEFVIRTPSGPKTEKNPIEQVRQYALAIVDQLQKEKSLCSPSTGRLLIPWGYCVVFTNLSRRVFEEIGLHKVMERHKVICQDEMTENISAPDFLAKLRALHPFTILKPLTLHQTDCIRGILYPDIRIDIPQGQLFNDSDVPTSIVKVMDIQQENLARSLGPGHRALWSKHPAACPSADGGRRSAEPSRSPLE
jgi:hypothetical protein